MQNGLTITNVFAGANAQPSVHLPIRSMVELEFKSYQVEGRKGVSVFTLYDDRQATSQNVFKVS